MQPFIVDMGLVDRPGHINPARLVKMEPNPYAPPQSPLLPPPLPVHSDAEAVRREHINTEATLKTVGVLYYLGAFIVIAAGLSMAANDELTSEWVSMAILVILGVVQFVGGFGLRRLRSWARIPTIILSGIGLLSFPIGTLINAYILVKVLGKQGRYVMTPEYQEIIAATPYVKNKTSRAVWIILGVLIVVLILVVVWVASVESGGNP